MRRLNDEEGVSMVLIGLLLVVLLAAAGIAVDLGRLYLERRELRNGADAAVLAIAGDCASGLRPCDDATAGATAAVYANSNAYDGTAGVEALELDATGQTVRLVAYAVDPDSGERGVEVPLMGLLGYDRMEVSVAAAAEWGFAFAGSGLPITIEECEFYKAAGYGPEHIITLYFHDAQSDEESTECPAGPANQDAPGGFGWLDPGGNVCRSFAKVGVWSAGKPGQPSPLECTADIIRDQIYLKTIPLPVYGEVVAAGNNVEYLIVGFAGFHVTAYDLGSAQYTEPSGFRCPQGAQATCLQGYFETDELSTGETGGPDFGVYVVKLTE